MGNGHIPLWAVKRKTLAADVAYLCLPRSPMRAQKDSKRAAGEKPERPLHHALQAWPVYQGRSARRRSRARTRALAVELADLRTRLESLSMPIPLAVNDVSD